MKLFGKPENKWGRVRVTGWAALAALFTWTLLAVVLRAVGPIPWLVWSGYPTFTVARGLELSMLPLLVVLIGSWLEEQECHAQTEQAKSHQAAEQRRHALRRFRQAVKDVLASANRSPGEHAPETRVDLISVLHSALLETDDKGKGEILQTLLESGLLTGEQPIIRLEGLDFSRTVIQKARLAGANLAGIDLSRARLEDACLTGSRLSGANLARAILRHADLQKARLNGSNLQDARLDAANLESCDLRNARLEGAVLAHANLKDAILDSQPAHTPGAMPIEQAILIETILPDGKKVTNLKGKEYLQKKEIATLIDRL